MIDTRSKITANFPMTLRRKNRRYKVTINIGDVTYSAYGRTSKDALESAATAAKIILTSHSHPSIVTETIAFTADENGDILDWDALYIHRGTHDHDAALHDLGYTTERNPQ